MEKDKKWVSKRGIPKYERFLDSFKGYLATL
jgi:hypothetical protein